MKSGYDHPFFQLHHHLVFFSLTSTGQQGSRRNCKNPAAISWSFLYQAPTAEIETASLGALAQRYCSCVVEDVEG